MKKVIALVLVLALACGFGGCGGSNEPTIENVEADAGVAAATITWTTDVDATSQVEYGTTTDYGSTTELDETLATSHSVIINNLRAETTYHYRVKSKDENGVESVSEDYTFTTAPPTLEISCSTYDISATTTALQLSNNEAVSGMVLDYGTTTEYGNTISEPIDMPEGGRFIFLEDLLPNKTYHYRITATDVWGNDVVSDDYTFTTKCMIAFVAQEDNNWGIAVIDEDGIIMTRLTDVETSRERDPVWSPDGDKIVFYAARGEEWENKGIYMVNIDGTNEVRLTDDSGYYSHPVWSPDGTKIAYEFSSDIYVMNADGTEKTQLTNNEFGDGAPAWSPDGTKIVFDSLRDDNWQVCMIDANGSNETNLTPDSRKDNDPSWSPDGTKIAFRSYRDVGDGVFEAGLYVMNADGSNQTKLAPDDLGTRNYIEWSPDGTKILFLKDTNLHVINADGSGLTNLTNHEDDDIDDLRYAWSPDGSKIAFTSGERLDSRTVNASLYVMNADGSDVTELTWEVYGSSICSISWCP